LTVQLTATYPNTAPILSTADTEFLRSDFKEEISKVILEKPSSLLGHEMIHEISESIEEILDRAAQNIAVNVEAPTLEEERALQEKTALEAAKKEEEEARAHQEEAKRDEERMMGRMLSAELQRRRERARQVHKTKRPPGLDETPMAIHDSEHSISFDRAVSIKDRKGNNLHFHTVIGLVKLRQGPATEVLLVHPQTSENTYGVPPALAIKRVKLKAIDDHGSYKRSIQDLEQELEKLKSLNGRSTNVIDILDFKITAEIGDNSWNVTILTEFANRGSLKESLEISGGGCPAIQNVRMRAVQLLDALEFYHCNGVVHGALHAANILFVESLSGPPTLKLADTGFQSRLRQLCDQSDKLAFMGVETQSPGWFPPDLLAEDQLRPTRKLDM
jgi:translation initiation factor 2-alpha kinase 4